MLADFAVFIDREAGEIICLVASVRQSVRLSYLLPPKTTNINSERNALIYQITNIYSSEHKLIYSKIFLNFLLE